MITDYYKNIANHVISTRRERLTSGFRAAGRPDHTGADFTDADRLELRQDIYILAFADGVADRAGLGSAASGLGYYIDIRHESGGASYLTRYCHLRGAPVFKAGQAVGRGDVLGIMGKTGNSTGIHLHFGLKEDSVSWDTGVWVDPEPYLFGAKAMGGAALPPAGAIAVGDSVRLTPSAAVYATGQSIPAWVKAGTYTVMQVKADRVLLKEIISWVFERDVTRNGK